MHTLLDDTVVLRTMPPECAGALLTAGRDLSHRYALDDPALIPAIMELVTGPLAVIHDLVQIPEGAIGVLIDQVPVPDPAEPTPASWKAAEGTAPASRLVLLLMAAALGKPFGWWGQQAGRLITDLVPTLGQDTTQTGASFSTELTLHTEDAFHPQRASHFMLFGLRNPSGTGTVLSPAQAAIETLSPEDRAILSVPGAPILPDTSYEPSTHTTPGSPMAAIWERRGGSGLRFDPSYTDFERASPHWRRAYAKLSEALHEQAKQIPVLPGQVIVIDNDACVHGRAPFTPRHDGTDRWLLRVNIAAPVSERPAAESAESGFGQQHHTPFTDQVIA